MIGASTGPGVGDQHRQVAHRQLMNGHVASLEPATHEPRAEPYALRGRGIEADQLLGEKALVHGRENLELGRFGDRDEGFGSGLVALGLLLGG